MFRTRAQAPLFISPAKERISGDRPRGRGALATGAAAAILASACCLGPLVLVSIGLGGAWISGLQALEPFRPIFVGVALFALLIAYRRIFRPVTQCAPGELCGRRGARTLYRSFFWVVTLLVAAILAFPYLAPLLY